MFKNFEVKPLFVDQIHERHQFQLNIQGGSYQAIYHEGEISWFHPLPGKDFEDNYLQAVESKVHELMKDYLN